MAPGKIALRGHPIEDLIGNVSFPQMIWMMTRGSMPSADEAKLLEAALVASVDHGPQAPSIAIARMTASCGVGLNNAMASGINALGDVHGGAGQQCVEMLHDLRQAAHNDGVTDPQAVAWYLDHRPGQSSKYLPGFGHRFHPIDPRAPRLMALVDHAINAGTVDGHFKSLALALEAELAKRKGKPIPMNIDGATAVIYAELGFAPALARGIFCLSRAVGILAHAWEESEAGTRNKGPL
ncbi:MAG: citryl-CoA lyase, partial [Pseudomonadota bacterium]